MERLVFPKRHGKGAGDMKNVKRVLFSVCCFIIFAAALCGCEKAASESANSFAFSDNRIYVPEFAKLPFEASGISSCLIGDGRAYLLAGIDAGKSETRLFITDLSGNMISPADGYGYDVPVSENADAFRSVALAEDEDGDPCLIWQTFAYGTNKAKLMCSKIGNDGTLSDERLITENIVPGAWIDGILFSGGKVYLTQSSRLEIYDKSGKNIIKDSEISAEGLFLLSDGRAAAISENSLCVFSGNGKTIENKIVLHDGTRKICAGGICDIVYSTETGLWAFDIESRKDKKLFDFTDVGINGKNIFAIDAKENGEIICLEFDRENKSVTIATLKLVESSETLDKKVLTLAITDANSMDLGYITEFNRESSDYRVEVICYSDYNTEENPKAGLDRLVLDITAGKTPDIFQISSFPVETFAEKGVFEDLTVFIEQDFGEDFLVNAYAEAVKIGGATYEVYQSFTVDSFVGLKSVVGEPENWTAEKLIEACGALSKGAAIFGDDTGETILMTLLRGNIGDYVDFESGECRFDGDEFISVLEFASSLNFDSGSGESQREMLNAGSQLLYNANIYSPAFYAAVKSYMFAEEVSFVGYPTSDGGKSYIIPGNGFAMSSVSENKEGAWEFMKTLLTEEYQSSLEDCFPTNKKAFEKLIAGNKEISAVGTNRYTFGNGIRFDEISDEEKASLLELINGTDSVLRTEKYDDIMNIISEECGALFSGQRSAKSVAATIQSRASVYINEKE